MKLCLVIDDFEPDRVVAAHIASDIGLSVIKVPGGEKGLETCATKTPQVILLDWSMPDMDGEEFIKALRKEPFGKNILVIMCSGVVDATKIKQAVSAGVDAYLVKPLTKESLRTKLTKLGLFDY